MKKEILNSYHYSLYTNNKKDILDKVFKQINEGNDMISLRSEDVLGLLVVNENDWDKEIMTYDDIYKVLKYAGVDQFFHDKKFYHIFEQLPVSILESYQVYSYEEIHSLLKLLSKKRVSNQLNLSIMLGLSYLFQYDPDFDESVLSELLYMNEIDYSVFKMDKYLKLDYYLHQSNMNLKDVDYYIEPKSYKNDNISSVQEEFHQDNNQSFYQRAK